MQEKSQKKTKELFLFFLFALVLIPLVSSQEIIGKQNTNINLIGTCFNNGTLCSASTVCNSTVISPTGVTLLNNSREQNGISFYNITLPSSKTGELGLYTQIRYCFDPVGPIIGSGKEIKEILVTPSGTDDSELNYLILLAAVVLVCIGLMIFGFNKGDPYTVIIGSMALVIISGFTLINGISNYRNVMTQWSSIIVMLSSGYIAIKSGLEAMNG